MIIDAHELDRSSAPPPYDVAVVGSGPAGLTVAAELQARGLRICVLESGQATRTAHGEGLKALRSEGDIVVGPRSRERVIGGTSSTWDGLSAPLDAIDLRARPWVPLSGWPIAHGDLLRYYAQAAERYGFAHPDLYTAPHLAALKADGDRRFVWQRLSERLLLAPTRPQRFARRLRPLLESPAVDLYTDATVVALLGSRSGPAVEACDVRTRGGRALRIRATVFVVAAGGIENPRLLLNSTDRCPRGS
jgi:choline dehydrogenase-like flavoprotein